MKWGLVFVVVCLAWRTSVSQAAVCPSLCVCREAGKEAEFPDQLKLKCGGAPSPITEIKEIDLSKISASIVSLNLSLNAISTLSRQLHLPALERLNVSFNQITLIESDAFYNLSSLQRLDLSHNQIGSIHRDMFRGLIYLERLNLAQNHIMQLAAGTFDLLVALKQLDITDNPLICDCELLWLGGWSRGAGVKLAGSPRCAYPETVLNKPVKKLRIFLDLSVCEGAQATAGAALVVQPARDQVIFEGDGLSLTCNAPFASIDTKYELKWTHVNYELCDVTVTNTEMQEEGIAETKVTFANVTSHHAGNWTCGYADEKHLKQNFTVQVLVLSNSTIYCRTEHTEGNKGLYAWPQVPGGRAAAVDCRSGEGTATRECLRNGTWLPPDTSECSYISNVTKLLEQFAALNLSLVPYAAVNASDRLAMLLREKVYPVAEVDDPDDVMFVAAAVKNYMQYLGEESDLGSSLLDVINAAMNISSPVLLAAERQYNACTALVRAAAAAAPHVRNVQGQKSNLAVERFPVTAGFSGLQCAWLPAAGGGAGGGAGGAGAGAPRLHCTGSNRTAPLAYGVGPRAPIAAVQVPASLLYAPASPGAPPAAAARELVVSVFARAALMPRRPRAGPPPRARDYYGRATARAPLPPAAPVVGLTLVNGTLSGPLLEPVLVTLRVRAGAARPRAAAWRAARAAWDDRTDACKITHTLADLVILSCTRLCYVTVLQDIETGIYGARTDGARFKVSHPAVYVGSLILIGCLACTALTYVTSYSVILMPRKAKHALINTWIALGLLCFMYTLGIYQTEDVGLCQAVGVSIHYLTLSSLLWMCVTANNMYKWATKTHNPSTPDEELPPDVPIQKPILGVYLVGWGISFIVCGVSGAVNIRDYAGYTQCFLSTAPALASVFIPAGVLVFFLLVVFLLIRCTIRTTSAQLSEGTQATEHVDLELWEPAAADARSVKSCAESECDDAEHAPVVQLRAQVIVVGLFLAAWACAAAAVYRPLPDYLPYQEDICSIVYAVCATILGTFVLFFYGIARSDVRAQWQADCRAPVRVTAVAGAGAGCAPPPATDNRSRSDTPKTSNALAAAALNSHTLQEKISNGKQQSVNNINLVVLHRRQYRADGGAAGPERAPVAAFYNPNQMNVAKKFFKRQRATKRNCLELPRGDAASPAPPAPPAPPAAALARVAYDGVAALVSNKVNNTNIHVERPCAKPLTHNPNLLQETDEYKTRKPLNGDINRRSVNIYTNVPETRVPQHQLITKDDQPPLTPETRTVSQQCSLDYSSDVQRTCSDHTLDTHSAAHSPLCSANETETESFGQYIDYLQPPKHEKDDKSLRDISEECPMEVDNGTLEVDEPAETDRLIQKETASVDADFDNTSEQDSDIYPNYQLSEVSIRSHGLYAPSPASICRNDMSFSTEDVSRAESQYVNYDPGWQTVKSKSRFPTISCPEVNRESPVSFTSELDELYTQITRDRGDRRLDGTLDSDVTLRPDTDSCVSEAQSDVKVETTV